MKEYISKSYIIDTLNALLSSSNGAEHYAYEQVMNKIDNVSMFEVITVEED